MPRSHPACYILFCFVLFTPERVKALQLESKFIQYTFFLYLRLSKRPAIYHTLKAAVFIGQSAAQLWVKYLKHLAQL